MVLLLLLGFLQFGAPADSNLVQQSHLQAKHYIQNIDQGRNIEENLWALTILTSGHPDIRKAVEQRVQAKKKKGNFLSLFENIEPVYSQQLKKVVFKTGSHKLLIDLLLVTKKNKQNLYDQFISSFDLTGNEGDLNYKLLAEHIIENKKIGDSIILSNSFSLPHLFLLYRAHSQLDESYKNTVVDNWSGQQGSSQTLHSSLYYASYLRALYLKYNYSKIATIFFPLLRDQFFPNSNLRLKIYQYLDYSMYRLGYFDRSLKIVRQHSLPLTSYLDKKKGIIQTKQLQGVYLYSIGKIKTAENIFEELLDTINQSNIQISKSSLLNNLALTYHKLGKYNQYVELQYQALNIAETKDNYSHQLKILNNLFIYYRKSNDPENAIEFLEKAKKIALQKGNADDLGTIYTSIGSFYREFKNKPTLANDFFIKAQNVLDPKNNRRYYIKVLNEQAQNFETHHQYELAIKKHDEILNLSSKEKGRNYIDALINKAQIYLKRENIIQAKKQIEEFKSFDLNQLDFNQIVKAKKVEADYLFQTENITKALNILEPTLNQVVVRAQNSTDLKSGFWHVEDEYLDAFELAASIYMETGRPGKAVEKLDQLKTINDASLYQNPLVKSSLLNESELTEYKQITNQLDVVRKKLLTAPEDQQFKIRQQINQLNTKKRKYDRRLSENIDQDPISIRQVQNKMSGRELLLHITELNDQYYIAKISRTDINLKTIDLNKRTRNLFSSAAQQIATHKTNLDSLYEITQILDLKEIPDYVDTITLIPDSYFYQLPLDILPLEKPSESYSYGETTYAIEKFNTQYLTTLEDFKTPTQPATNFKAQINYAGYGVSNLNNYTDQSLVPLPYAQSEVTQIAKGLTNLSQVQTYVNEQSTKSNFKQTAPNSRIIHLATHSEVSERDPMFSTIYFNKSTAGSDSTFDDRFFAYELFEMDLSNEMVMLNSCESGSGSYIQGTGVMGISRALQYAGAKSLILNLWSVNDMLASDFAIQFYRHLNEGKSKAEALRAAKQYFLNNKNADPHYWGPYMLIGNTNPVVKPQQNKNLAVAGAFIFYFILMVALSYLTQQGFIFSKR